jgi:hypothetical protein
MHVQKEKSRILEVYSRKETSEMDLEKVEAVNK